VLGPVLFLVHIADIAKGTSPLASTSTSADDTRIRRTIKDPEVDLEAVYRWADVNMKFNADKFECLRFWLGRTKNPETVQWP
jgi:hypothetical protein